MADEKTREDNRETRPAHRWIQQAWLRRRINAIEGNRSRAIPHRGVPRTAKIFWASFYRTVHSSQFILAVLALAGWFGFASVERMTRKTLADTLTMTLNANEQTLHGWLQTKKSEVKGWANYQDSRKEILQLLELAERDGSREALLGSGELARLRTRLGPVCKNHNFAGFVIFDKTGLQVGALFDGSIGKRDLAQKSDFAARSLRGETIVSSPFLDDPWVLEDAESSTAPSPSLSRRGEMTPPLSKESFA